MEMKAELQKKIHQLESKCRRLEQRGNDWGGKGWEVRGGEVRVMAIA